MNAPRKSRRARAALELAGWEIETATVLGRDTSALERAYSDALARVDDEGQQLAQQRRARFQHAQQDGAAAVRAVGVDVGVGGVELTTTNKGARIFRLVTESFPRHINYVYLLEIDGTWALWDCGSGLARAREMLLDGFAVVRTVFGVDVDVTDIDAIVVSHGHYDHFGDALWWKETTRAPLWVHELDARVLEHFGERTVMIGRDMRLWLREAGVGADDCSRLVDMYLAAKDVYAPVAVDRRLQHKQTLFGAASAPRARVIHTPGHCPGHICLRVDDVLLVADQVLTPVSPHLSPQALHPHNGLERYLFGLGRLALERDVAKILPAHYEPVLDLQVRIREIAEEHVEKLAATQAACARGATVADVAAALFGKQEHYNELLAVLEAGTHVEYLHQIGLLRVQNLDAVQSDPSTPPSFVTTSEATTFEQPVMHKALGGG